MTAKKPPELLEKPGAPTKYKTEYCQVLIDHMKKGGSLESFAAKIPCSKQTVYNWLDAHPEFLDARKVGEPFMHEFYENMAKTIATGQLRRLVSEKVARDKDGEIVRDKEGNPVFDRVYEATSAGQSVFIFLTKNLLNWRDRKDVALQDPDGKALNWSNVTDDELRKKLAELQKEVQKYLPK